MLNHSRTHRTPGRVRPPSTTHAGATRRRVVLAVALVAVTAGGIRAARELTSPSQQARPAADSQRLPQTATAWLAVYRAAVPANPTRVCRDPYTARLRARARSELHVSCETFVRRHGPVPVRLMRLQTHGPTAVLDLYVRRTRHYSAAVLVRERGGLRVLQFIPRSAPPNPRRGNPTQRHN